MATAGSAGGGTSWSAHFNTVHDVAIDGTQNTFRVYSAGDDHGAQAPVVVLLHGAGHTSLSWALVAGLLKAQCRVVAMDFRGHGGSITTDDSDLSADTLTSDVLAVLRAFLGPGPRGPDRDAGGGRVEGVLASSGGRCPPEYGRLSR